MPFNLEELKKHLLDLGFEHLFHANTLETSLSYMKEGLLMSRGEVEGRGLPQTSQFTDGSDKKYAIWNSLFFNLYDQHTRFKRPNAYGPILFKISISKLFEYLGENNAEISITKIQPHKWRDHHSTEDKWHLALNDVLSHEFPFKVNGWPDLVISNVNSGVPLVLFDEIVIDRIPEDSDFFERSSSQFFESLKAVGSVSISITERQQCAVSCKCSDITEFKKSNISLGLWENRKKETA